MNTQEINTAIAKAFNIFMSGDAKRAEFELGHLLIRHPGNAGVLAAMADFYYQNCNMRQAVPYAMQAESCLTANASLDEILYVSQVLRCIGEDESANAIPRGYVKAINDEQKQLARLAYHFLNLDLIEESLVAFNLADDSALDDFDMAMRGIAMLYAADIDGAKAMFLKALRLNPGNAIAALQMAMLDIPAERDGRIAQWQALCNGSIPDADRALLYFALFHEYDAKGDFPNAFESLRSGNAIRLANQRYNAEMESELVDDYIKQLTVLDFSSEPALDSDAAIPIFIIGLPRTGTTLLEKTLTSLADVQAVGEHLNFRKSIERQLGLVFTSPFEITNRTFSKTLDFSELGRRYREKTLWRADGKPYYTDKEPFNFAYAGLIAKAMPEARIIHIRRNPMDACFSAYKQSFALGSFPASYSLDSLVTFYRNYERVMAFWREALGPRMLEIRYEDLVLRHADTVQKIKNYCQLKEPAVANQNKSYKASTLSAAQVQKPIHAGNINAWAKYSDYLQPLRAALDKEYTEYMAAIEGVEIL